MLDKIAFSEETLQKRISELGEEIGEDYRGKELILVGVMKGSLFFLCDLARNRLAASDRPISIGIYPNATGRTGAVRITKDLDYDISGKHVLLIEDIVRSGLTTGYLMQNLESRGAASIQICTLLLSPEEQLIQIPLRMSVFEVNKTRLWGYGLDVEEKGRNLPHIAIIPT